MRASPWGAGTCLVADEPGAETEELLVLVLTPREAGVHLPTPKYNQSSLVPMPCPIADSWVSFQPHNQLHSSTSSMGPASSCPL